MPRATLAESNIHPAIRDKISKNQQAIVAEVQAAVAAHPVVVVGMGLNPMPKKARKALDAAGIAHHDMDYGSYFSEWRKRNVDRLANVSYDFCQRHAGGWCG